MTDRTASRTPLQMREMNSVAFADAVERVVWSARQLGLEPPSFRCPPSRPELDRSIRRQPDGVTVSVRIAERSMEVVEGDLAEGVLVANELSAERRAELRPQLTALVSRRRLRAA